ncbi:MAG TPA: SpoIIE family protein phosphatase [Chthonomonadaceae bacterium]|nr:SpoIIE family protein phosphatase [Chthonomonadaceae bacterium]
MKILIAEDDPIPRRLLQATLVKAGYEVVMAKDGEEAWQLLQQAEAPNLAILDWLMPGLDGVEVCRRVRQRAQAPYVYILLLTSKDRKEDLIEGMNAGADDYLIKPFDPHELQVRLRAGQRILDLETALRNSLEQLEQARHREVETGARIQKTLLLGQPPRALPGAQVAALTIPSQQIDGDFYDFFQHNDGCLDVVVGDVMGKGVPAALLGAAIKSHFLHALSRLLGPAGPGNLPTPEQIVTLVHAEVTRQFIGLEFFATLCYARFDLSERQLTFVDCGHTKTIHFRQKAGACALLEGENMPLGVSEKEVYRQVAVPFEAGDLFCFYSDGVTEARNPEDAFFGVDRLVELVRANGQSAPQALLDRIHGAVVAFSGAETFSDDLTCVAIKIGAVEAASPLAHAELEVSSDLSQLAPIRAFVRQFCRNLPSPTLDEDSQSQLELAVNEAASNVMRHAYRGRTDQPIRIEAEAFADQIRIRILHSGEEFDPAKVRPPAFDGTREGGFGVYMIGQSVDEVRYSRNAQGQNTICLIKNRKPVPGG